MAVCSIIRNFSGYKDYGKATSVIHGKDDQLPRVNAKAFVVVVRLGLRSFEGTGSRDGGGWVESGDEPTPGTGLSITTIGSMRRIHRAT